MSTGPELSEFPQTTAERVVRWLEKKRQEHADSPALVDSFNREIDVIKSLPEDLGEAEMVATCRAIMDGFDEERKPYYPTPHQERQPINPKRLTQTLTNAVENSTHKRLERLLAEEPSTDISSTDSSK